jgi:hypothetical protein
MATKQKVIRVRVTDYERKRLKAVVAWRNAGSLSAWLRSFIDRERAAFEESHNK